MVVSTGRARDKGRMDADALTLLKLLIEWGADEAIADSPTDRLTPALARATPTPVQPVAEKPVPRRIVPGVPATERAHVEAAGAHDLDALRAAIAGFDAIALRDTASGPILFEGDPAGRLLIVLPPPTGEEDRAGRLLAGPAGDFLGAMLASIGLRDRALFAPLIPWRPPGDRPPSQTEIAACLPFLHRLIVLARPALAVLIGPLVARAFLPGERRPPRGTFSNAELPGRSEPLPCLPMDGVVQLRSDPDARRLAWRDLRVLRRRIDEEVTPL